ncbi:MAG: LON peptidase substrate-binding domain-containing protein [Flavobacteriales bacterium]|nr:LON peptidase substrate-binding domain-containing protein [Flavobacteriales bacterium]
MNANKQYFGLFPLRIFLFPGEQTTLHVFEPRYLQLINECLDKNEAFGIPYQGKTTLSELGSLVKVIQILKKYDNGELDVLVECSSNFKINHFEGKKKDKLYPCGTILQLIKAEFKPTEELKSHAKNYLSHLLDKEQDDKNENLLSINNLINLVNLSDDEKIKFLKLPEQKKNDYLINKFKFMLILLTQEKKVDQNFYLN